MRPVKKKNSTLKQYQQDRFRAYHGQKLCDRMRLYTEMEFCFQDFSIYELSDSDWEQGTDKFFQAVAHYKLGVASATAILDEIVEDAPEFLSVALTNSTPVTELPNSAFVVEVQPQSHV